MHYVPPSPFINLHSAYVRWISAVENFFFVFNVQLALPCRSIKKFVSQIPLSLLLSTVEHNFCQNWVELPGWTLTLQVSVMAWEMSNIYMSHFLTMTVTYLILFFWYPSCAIQYFVVVVVSICHTELLFKIFMEKMCICVHTFLY